MNEALVVVVVVVRGQRRGEFETDSVVVKGRVRGRESCLRRGNLGKEDGGYVCVCVRVLDQHDMCHMACESESE
jgi:hypothetical protein